MLLTEDICHQVIVHDILDLHELQLIADIVGVDTFCVHATFAVFYGILTEYL